MLLRKIYKNKWMIISLLIGLILCTSMTSGISMYSRAVLHRILSNDFKNFQVEKGIYPGSYSVYKKLGLRSDPEDSSWYTTMLKEIKSTSENISGTIENEIPLSVLTKRTTLMADYFTVDRSRTNESYVPRIPINIMAISGIEDHIEITQGSMYSTEKNSEGEYEVILSEASLRELNLVVGRSYYMYYLDDDERAAEDLRDEAFKIRVAGVYTYKDEGDTFFGDEGWQYKNSVIMNYDLFKNVFLRDEEFVLREASWYYGFDYKEIKIDDTKEILDKFDELEYKLENKNDSTTAVYHAREVLDKYTGKNAQVGRLLILLMFPVILLSMVYITMVSHFIVEDDSNEIAVLKSRGAGRLQILSMYLLQGGIIGGAAIVIGPILGAYMCRIIGASNGFLEFVQRKALTVDITWTEYLYSSIMTLIFLGAMMIPVIRASKISIVERKQRSGRISGKPLWKRLYLDIVFIGLVAYSVYTYIARVNSLKTSVAQGRTPIDPLLYIVSALFSLGIAMLFLRIYPYIIRFVFWIGKKIWSPSAYISMLNIGKGEEKYGFLVIFLIMTVSVGIFNVNAAGIINKTLERQTQYSVGADIVLSGESKITDDGKPAIDEDIISQISEIKGIEKATKVLYRSGARVILGNEKSEDIGIKLFGINPKEFGEISYIPKELLPYHYYEYLNLLAKDPRAMLISSNIGKRYGLKQGDIVNVRWDDGISIEGYIAAFIDYWPSYIPTSYDGKSLGSTLLVANIDYLSRYRLIWPYDVWAKKSGEVSDEEIYKGIEESSLKFTKFVDANQQLIKSKGDAMLQGTNGALTLGFMATMIVTISGFLIYWISSIKSRILQFGIFRAMGMGLSKLISILLYEQLLISGVSIIMGIIIGQIGSRIFIPIIQSASSPYSRVIPVNIVQTTGDYIGLFIYLALMISVGFMVLGRYIAGIRMDQAIKLGED